MAKLDFGATFSRVFDLYGKYFVSLITYSAIFYGAVALVWALIAGLFLTNVALGAVVGLIGVVLTVIAGMLITGAYIVAITEVEQTGNFPGFGEVWPRVTPLLGPLVITSILAGLGILLGMILLVVPGLILATWWFVAAPVVMLEGTSGSAALGRSRELVRGNGWTVFGLFIVVSILVGIANGIIGGIAGAIFSFNDIVQTFVSEWAPGVLTGPISALLTVIVYQSLTGTGQGTDAAMPPVPPATGDVSPQTQVPPPATPPSDPGHQGPFV